MPYSATRNPEGTGISSEIKPTGATLEVVKTLLQAALAGPNGDFGPINADAVNTFLSIDRKRNRPADYLNVGDESNPLTR